VCGSSPAFAQMRRASLAEASRVPSGDIKDSLNKSRAIHEKHESHFGTRVGILKRTLRVSRNTWVVLSRPHFENAAPADATLGWFGLRTPKTLCEADSQPELRRVRSVPSTACERDADGG
jgi:hypothetical protein